MKRLSRASVIGLGIVVAAAVTVVALDVPKRASTEVITDKELANAKSSYDGLQVNDRTLIDKFVTSWPDHVDVGAASDLTVAEIDLDSSIGARSLVAWDPEVAIDSITVTSTRSLRAKRFAIEIELDRNAESTRAACVLVAVSSQWSSNNYHRLSMCAQGTHRTDPTNGTTALSDYSELWWVPDDVDDVAVTDLQVSTKGGNPKDHGLWIRNQTPEVGAEFTTPSDACGGTPARMTYVADTRTVDGFTVPSRYCFPIETLDYFSTQRSSYGVGIADAFTYTDPVWFATVGKYAYAGKLEDLPPLQVSIKAEARLAIF